jgi:lipopolysaccharide/colanic/teichoic acid biosynthesis glycosyltransferase
MNTDRISRLSNLSTKISGDSFQNLLNAAIKRGFDILASMLGLIVLSPFFLAIAIMVKRESPGPAFYRGARIGLKGRTFGILKFRTMYEHPESYRGARVTARDDRRITPFGRWLRDTKLNELPQLWNVLTGEMSLVGPRPEDPGIAMNWPASARHEILSVRPGITSPASILYHDEETLLSAANVMGEYFKNILPDKLRLDRLYVRNHSFVADLDILLWTLAILIPRMANQRIPESFLFAGPISRLTRRHVSWFMIDLVISLASVGITGLAWRSLGPINWGLEPLAILALALAVLFSCVNLMAGLNRIVWSRAGAADGLILVLSNRLTTLLLHGLNHLLPLQLWKVFPPLPAELITVMGALALVGSLAARYRLRLVSAFTDRWLSSRRQRSRLGERILILGAGDGGQIASWLLQRSKLQQAFSIVGMVDDDPNTQGMRIGNCWVLGGTGDLPALVRKHDVGVILFAISNVPAERKQQLLKLCNLPGVRLVFISDILNSVQAHLTPRQPEHTSFASMGALSSQFGMSKYELEK